MNTNYPNYYKVVNIQYSKDSHSIKAGKAWLAINDNGNRIKELAAKGNSHRPKPIVHKPNA